jgi:hypothetical protein
MDPSPLCVLRPDIYHTTRSTWYRDNSLCPRCGWVCKPTFRKNVEWCEGCGNARIPVGCNALHCFGLALPFKRTKYKDMREELSGRNEFLDSIEEIQAMSFEEVTLFDENSRGECLLFGCVLCRRFSYASGFRK